MAKEDELRYLNRLTKGTSQDRNLQHELSIAIARNTLEQYVDSEPPTTWREQQVLVTQTGQALQCLILAHGIQTRDRNNAMMMVLQKQTGSGMFQASSGVYLAERVRMIYTDREPLFMPGLNPTEIREQMGGFDLFVPVEPHPKGMEHAVAYNYTREEEWRFARFTPNHDMRGNRNRYHYLSTLRTATELLLDLTS